MNKIDIDRCISAKFAFEEAMNAAFHDIHERITETSIALPLMSDLRAVSEAVDVLPTVKHADASGNPVIRHVLYGGCSFWTHEGDPVPGGDA